MNNALSRHRSNPTHARRVPLAWIDAELSAEPIRGTTTLETRPPVPSARVDAIPVTTTLESKGGQRADAASASKGDQRSTGPSIRRSTTPGNLGGFRVFQTRRMPSQMLAEIKAVASLLQCNQQDVVFACIRVGLQSVIEREGITWQVVHRLVQRGASS